MMDRDCSQSLSEQVRAAGEQGRALCIRGNGSKAFVGREVVGDVLDTGAHTGLVWYEPTELVCTARAGTPLAELESTLAEQGQMMPFDPPRFGGAGTLGGAVAAGLSGPARPWRGSVRDFVLGVRMINGRGERLRFGGAVMKNVAGYDVSRLVTGSYGTLGVLLEVSFKVLPAPQATAACMIDVDEVEGFRRVEQAFRKGFPVSGAAHDGQTLHVRLSGTAGAVKTGQQHFGGIPDDDEFWPSLRDQTLSFFHVDDSPLWRVSVPPSTETATWPGERLTDWCGQLHWIRTDTPAAEMFRLARERGGHATLLRNGAPDGDIFQPLPASVHGLHRRIREAFDPFNILNPGRMYAED